MTNINTHELSNGKKNDGGAVNVRSVASQISHIVFPSSTIQHSSQGSAYPARSVPTHSTPTRRAAEVVIKQNDGRSYQAQETSRYYGEVAAVDEDRCSVASSVSSAESEAHSAPPAPRERKNCPSNDTDDPTNTDEHINTNKVQTVEPDPFVELVLSMETGSVGLRSLRYKSRHEGRHSGSIARINTAASFSSENNHRPAAIAPTKRLTNRNQSMTLADLLEDSPSSQRRPFAATSSRQLVPSQNKQQVGREKLQDDDELFKAMDAMDNNSNAVSLRSELHSAAQVANGLQHSSADLADDNDLLEDICLSQIGAYNAATTMALIARYPTSECREVTRKAAVSEAGLSEGYILLGSDDANGNEDDIRLLEVTAMDAFAPANVDSTNDGPCKDGETG
jgi:hypothetical protein